MATSGIATFTVTRDDIIKSSLRALKVIAIGETPQTEDYTNCAFALNLILKNLATDGYLLHLYQTLSFTLTANKSSYTISEAGSDVTNLRPLRVPFAYRRDSSSPANDIALNPLARQQYEMLTPKLAQGIPNSFYYDPGTTIGTFYPWPVPTDATNTARLLIERPIQDITASGENFDLPQVWFLPLKWILSDEVSLEYEVDLATIKTVQQRAMAWREKIANFDREEASVMFQPDPQSTFRGGFR